MRAVLGRARLHPRYFYESFSDLDELVVAVYDQVVADLGDVVLAALGSAGDDPGSRVRAVVGAVIDFVDEDRRRGRVLYVEGIGNEALNQRRLEAGQGVVAFIESYASTGRTTAPGDQIGRVASAILVGGFTQLLVEWLAGRVRVGKDALAADAAELFLAIGGTGRAIAERRAGPA